MSMRPEGPADSAQLSGLLERIQGRDEQALDQFYAATSKRVYSITLRILGQQELAEEATMEVYTKIWRMADTFDQERGTVPIWLNVLARNIALGVRRRENRIHRREYYDEAALFSSAIPAPQEQALNHSQQMDKITDLMSHLSPDQRNVVDAAYFQGLSHSQIAEELSMPLGSVKTRMRAALVYLRQGLIGDEGKAS